MLIGLCGKAGAGKDTVGIMLSQHGFKTYAMAGPLKAMLAAAGFDEPSREWKEKPIPGFDFSYREAAQVLGTEWGRRMDKDIWIKLAENAVAQHSLPGADSARIVITDLRFQNEVDMVRSLGGVIVQVVGRNADLGTNAGHASEVGIPEDYIDYVIHNDSSIEHLSTLVETLLWNVHGEVTAG